MNKTESAPPTDFIRTIINGDMNTDKYGGRVHTRFPPEPNGYLHIGHAKSICLNFGVASEYGGLSNLRFDDTNPSKEETEYVDSIQEDIHWLGFDWDDRLFYASDYFDQLYEYAVQLIKQGDAYICDLSSDEIREYRGTLTRPGKDSPYRNRPVEENLDLFERMRAGEFPDGSRTLRAKIDMASPNITMRDPVLYRIMKVPHHRTGDKWCVYPMYDFTHCLSDSIEGITHSLCTNWYRTGASMGGMIRVCLPYQVSGGVDTHQRRFGHSVIILESLRLTALSISLYLSTSFART
jgi:glutaminyl-tRNA synthetase